jgi:hypothetical protein
MNFKKHVIIIFVKYQDWNYITLIFHKKKAFTLIIIFTSFNEKLLQFFDTFQQSITF